MKVNRFFTSRIRQLIFFICALLISNAAAQSGRELLSVPAPLPGTSPISRDTAEQNPINPQAEQYKFIFSKSYRGPFKLKYDDLDRARRSGYQSFIEQLNIAGGQGYRLMSAVSGWDPKAIVKLDEGRYEYAWFDTTGGLFFAKEDFSEKFASYAKQGFRLVKHLNVSSSCWDEGPFNYGAGGRMDTSGRYEVCTYKDLFLMEREIGVERPIKYALATGYPAWKIERNEVMTQQIEENFSQGIYPSIAFSQFEMLLQEPARLDGVITEKPELRVITKRSWKLGGVRKPINELAKEGFRVAFAGRGISLMYRNAETTAPLSYVWIDTKKKNYENQLAQLQSAGAIFRMTYPDKDGAATYLLFEQQDGGDAKRREYKILNLKFQYTEDTAAWLTKTELDPASKQALSEMNRLIKEGFTVRCVFGSYKPSLLLER